MPSDDLPPYKSEEALLLGGKKFEKNVTYKK